MILVKLRGGLSNQLFQYAAARRLAHIHQTQVLIDTSWYNAIPHEATTRFFELDQLNISGRIATANECIGTNGVRQSKLSELPVALWRKLSPKWKYVEEKSFAFDPQILTLPDASCLYGYWCSEKYFIDCADLIREEFQFSALPDAENQKWIREMQSTVSVAVHIRRGDYASNPEYTKIHGLCSPEYYAAAEKLIAQRYPNAQLYIFSDDPEWVKTNMQFLLPAKFMTHNRNEKNPEDLRLMAHCQHHIIANSGFSWWGAWLARNSEKMVIAPKQWFNEAQHDTRDLYPQNWIKL